MSDLRRYPKSGRRRSPVVSGPEGGGVATTSLRFPGMGLPDGTQQQIRMQSGGTLNTFIDVAAATLLAVQFKFHLTANPSGTGQVVFNAHNSLTFYVSDDRRVSLEFSGGTVIESVAQATLGVDAVGTFIRNASGLWSCYVNSDTLDSTISKATAYSPDYCAIWQDFGGHDAWNQGSLGNVLQAFRYWKAGVYTVPSALVPADAGIEFVGVAGY